MLALKRTFLLKNRHNNNKIIYPRLAINLEDWGREIQISHQSNSVRTIPNAVNFDSTSLIL
jgi:hypothetical protein